MRLYSNSEELDLNTWLHTNARTVRYRCIAVISTAKKTSATNFDIVAPRIVHPTRGIAFCNPTVHDRQGTAITKHGNVHVSIELAHLYDETHLILHNGKGVADVILLHFWNDAQTLGKVY